MSVAGIYQIRNTTNGHCYIGQSIDVAARWRSHRATLGHGRGVNPYLQSAWDKYGADAFEFEVLVAMEPSIAQQELDDLEQDYVDFFRPAYNLQRECTTTVRGLRWSLSDETRARQSAAQRGRTFSAEARANMARAHAGHRHTIETRTKMSATRKGQKRLGTRHTAEWKAAQSARLIGHTVSDETRAILSAIHRADHDVFAQAGRKGGRPPKKQPN